MPPKPCSVLILSSKEGLDLAGLIQGQLDHSAEAVVWTDEVFQVGQVALESLIEAVQSVDFAVVVLTSDDTVIERDQKFNEPRDNVIFELGLCVGCLGRARTIMVHSRDEPPKLPSDLKGILPADFRGAARDAKASTVGAACSKIKKKITDLGARRGRVVENHPLAKHLAAISDVTASAYRRDNEVLQNEVRRRVQGWENKSQKWGDGKIVVRSHYTSVLQDVYRLATRSIFSTSIPGYLAAWSSTWGQELLRIQEQNQRADSTRVFIFKARADLTDENRRLMEFHQHRKIAVRVYFAEDHESTFPAELGHDWTVVDDGEVIGVTSKLGDIYEAVWYFGDQAEAKRFREFRERLTEESKPL